MTAKGPYNTPRTSILILLSCSLFINAAEGTTATLTESTAYASQRPCAKRCFYWGAASQGGADFLADRIGCDVDPIENECICRSDLQQTADSFLRKCVSDKCGSNAIDISSAVSIYDDYYDRDDFIRYADRPCDRNGDCRADGAGVWGTTSAAGSPWTTVRTRLTVVDALVSTSQATTASSTSEKASDRTTESTRQSVPSATLSTTTTSPTAYLGTGEGDKSGQGDGSKLKVGEIVGIVVGILGFIATAVGSWFSYKTLKQRKRLAANAP
ncbi:uncharacterized protein NFIA_002880 [Aspergillus fischeri NRRL 181]|uniref:Extracellular membrane protein CFEM domain-containing protein n=1 Tax=Neosartorya fischeri (strain ATCC 1020 / DSM 3700 / CBS 544.65 / FGSC A1164 / JCM 1740 / NRRL 181 / WB 181) TaxID=331117 RepID=A1DJP6_NEOFI|nr:uncharacterized protein NFIA_002880 [Aspergillus fischeri NRRL 181]EAW16935.1 hypothetical protein NFIA_002880 [Aspergillus fischeri NRRL 181]